jgi:hypothetical protein
MRTDRAYIKRRQVRAERRNARAKRRAKEHGSWPPNDEQTDAPSILSRMFKGIHPMTPFQRMTQMERAQDRAMKEAWS